MDIIVSDSEVQEANSTWASGNFTHLYVGIQANVANFITSKFWNSNEVVIDGLAGRNQKFQFTDPEFIPKKEASIPIVFEFVLEEQINGTGGSITSSYTSKAKLENFHLNIVLKLIITTDGYIKLSTYNNIGGH